MSKPNLREMSFLKEHFEGENLEKAIKRFENGEPLAYIIGEWYFYGLTFRLNTDCLIPRPDTEHIVEALIEYLPENSRFADFCTGSGCIAISALYNRKDTRAFLLDISENAIKMAKLNAEINGVSERAEFETGDVFKISPKNEEFDIICSNPPYIKTKVIPTLETVKNEPQIALDGGENGMDFYDCFLKNYGKALKNKGKFIFEIGYDQRQDIENLAQKYGYTCKIRKDYGGNDRVAILEKQYEK